MKVSFKSTLFPIGVLRAQIKMPDIVMATAQHIMADSMQNRVSI